MGCGPNSAVGKAGLWPQDSIFSPGMKVFVSSVITGLESFRDAAVSAVSILGYETVRAEDFPASSQSPQQACLAAVRRCDAVVLLLGAAYGQAQRSGLSATHEEYREARERIPVLAFVQEGIRPEHLQSTFIEEVRGWESGLFTSKFASPADLKTKVIKGLHDLLVNTDAPPLDADEIANRAKALIPPTHTTSNTGLLVAVASGPHQTVLRPSQLHDDELRRFLLREALTGENAVLASTNSTSFSVRDNTINVVQDHDRMVSLRGSGDLLVQQPARNAGGLHTALPCLIEEDITERISNAFRFAARVLDRIDGSLRLTHFAAAVGLRNAGYLPWRTRAEHQRSPNQATIGVRAAFGVANPVIITLSPPVQPRPALLAKAEQTAQDFTVTLRWKLKP